MSIKINNMDREQYRAAVMELNKKPPMKETPKGQKFNIGDHVITIEGFWGDEPVETDEFGFTKSGFLVPSRCHDKGKKATIEYSYYQKFGDHSRVPNPKDRNLNIYSLKYDDGGGSSWWEANKLKLL